MPSTAKVRLVVVIAVVIAVPVMIVLAPAVVSVPIAVVVATSVMARTDPARACIWGPSPVALVPDVAAIHRIPVAIDPCITRAR